MYGQKLPMLRHDSKAEHKWNQRPEAPLAFISIVVWTPDVSVHLQAKITERMNVPSASVMPIFLETYYSDSHNKKNYEVKMIRIINRKISHEY